MENKTQYPEICMTPYSCHFYVILTTILWFVGPFLMASLNTVRLLLLLNSFSTRCHIFGPRNETFLVS